jgi:hypothetical protein
MRTFFFGAFASSSSDQLSIQYTLPTGKRGKNASAALCDNTQKRNESTFKSIGRANSVLRRQRKKIKTRSSEGRSGYGEDDEILSLHKMLNHHAVQGFTTGRIFLPSSRKPQDCTSLALAFARIIIFSSTLPFGFLPANLTIHVPARDYHHDWKLVYF